MPYIHPKGSPSSRIWVITDQPLSTDLAKGYLFSGGLGWVFDKMMKDAGINDYYVAARRPDTDDLKSYNNVDGELNTYKPPFIIALDTVSSWYCSECEPGKGQKTHKTQLGKYVGSLLQAKSGLLNYPHFVMPMWEPAKFIQDWSERNIATYFDFQKLRLEHEFWLKNGLIQPLPFRQLIYEDLDINVLISHIKRMALSPIVSVDIETCYPKGDSEFKPHPGYPITIGLANSPSFGISFNLFRDSKIETVLLWRELDALFSNPKVTILGQNFFNFDAHFLSMLGFSINRRRIQDTLIRHHILWPELPHKLQFLTRQYTREPYYKDEGHNWNLKNMRKLRRYNALDVTVTFEVYNEQESEFAERKELVA